MTHDHVTWNPYTEHIGVRPLHRLTYYQGFTRNAMCMMLYLLDRIAGQFGFIQGIPTDPSDIRETLVTPDMADEMWAEFGVHNITLSDPILEGQPYIVLEYLEWYKRVSLPYIFLVNYPTPDESPQHSM